MKDWRVSVQPESVSMVWREPARLASSQKYLFVWLRTDVERFAKEEGGKEGRVCLSAMESGLFWCPENWCV